MATEMRIGRVGPIQTQVSEAVNHQGLPTIQWVRSRIDVNRSDQVVRRNHRSEARRMMRRAGSVQIHHHR